MGYVTVRAALVSRFSPTNLPLVSTTLAGREKDMPAVLWGLSRSNGSGAVLITHLPSDEEVRKAGGGPTQGEKFTRYPVSLEVLFQSVKDSAVDAQADRDTLVDSIKALIRLDRTLGAPTVIFSAGEGTFGIKVHSALPVIGKQLTILNFSVEFEVLEYVDA